VRLDVATTRSFERSRSGVARPFSATACGFRAEDPYVAFESLLAQHGGGGAAPVPGADDHDVPDLAGWYSRRAHLALPSEPREANRQRVEAVHQVQLGGWRVDQFQVQGLDARTEFGPQRSRSIVGSGANER
jgi:hypothetical protein